jgi:hypothetical protein
MMPFEGSTFTLDISGVAGFFGGEETVSAMATVHIYQGRKWLGWYNSPGSYTVAKKYGQLAKSRFYSGLFPGIKVNPNALFELEGETGPEFLGSHSGTHIKDTGHVGHLFSRECEDVEGKPIGGRVTQAVPVTIAKLHIDPDTGDEFTIQPSRRWASLLAAFPILTSAAGCVVCAYFGDWYCSSMILLGILSSGISCLVIGAGTLKFAHPRALKEAPEGSGLMDAGTQMVVLLGPEKAVTAVTRGSFSLKFSSEPKYSTIGLSALLLNIQFLLQLLLLPQGTIFGQLVFVITFAVSWAYSCFLSSLDREKIQRDILLSKVLYLDRRHLRKYIAGTRTAMAVFVLLILRPGDPRKLLNHLLPNDTRVWKKWKEVVLGKLDGEKPFTFEENDYEGVDVKERQLLEKLYADVETAHAAYERYEDDIQSVSVKTANV